MAWTPLNWFLVTSGALQVVVALALLSGKGIWQRAAALAFLVNGVLTPTAGLPALAGPANTAMLLLDGLTGSLIFLFAFTMSPREARTSRVVVSFLCAWHVALAGLWSVGALAEDWLRVLYQTLPLIAGYLGVLVWVVRPAIRDPKVFGEGTIWIAAAFFPRVVELPLRYLALIDPAAERVLFLGMLVVGLTTLAVLTLLALTLVRTPDARPELGILAAFALLGLILALPDASGSAAASGSEIVRRLSLVVVRPVLFLVGVLGLARSLDVLTPLGIAGAAAFVFAALTARAFGEASPAYFADLVGVCGGAVVAIPIWYARRRQAPRLAALPDVEKWRLLLTALAGSQHGTPDERYSRSGLARAVGMQPRNVHRVVLDINERAGIEAISWVVRRGLSNQRKYYYCLTPAGRAYASSTLGSVQTVKREPSGARVSRAGYDE